ncbi:MAG: efflux RND transporter permease subunit, partial [Chthoniobacterales bacterium]
MIEKLIEWCVRNRVMVLLLCGFLIAAGWYSAKNITVDAIPDLSDVQVVIRTEYAGQAPRIVEDQVTYPLTTAMLAVPYAKVVRGYSMFGTSFVYVIFEDGTDIYWARSRVLEQLNSVTNRLPSGVAPQLGPDATGVGWIFQYVLTTGPYCEKYPDGLWHDPETGRYYASQADITEPARSRLVLQRTFPGFQECPLDGSPLVQPKIDLSDLRSLQDWYLRYELTAVDGVSEVAPI